MHCSLFPDCTVQNTNAEVSVAGYLAIVGDVGNGPTAYESLDHTVFENESGPVA